MLSKVIEKGLCIWTEFIWSSNSWPNSSFPFKAFLLSRIGAGGTISTTDSVQSDWGSCDCPWVPSGAGKSLLSTGEGRIASFRMRIQGCWTGIQAGCYITKQPWGCCVSLARVWKWHVSFLPQKILQFCDWSDYFKVFSKLKWATKSVYLGIGKHLLTLTVSDWLH